jgi:hypothetical protein
VKAKRRCRKANVVHDLFHVIAKDGPEAMERVRFDEANRRRHDQAGRHQMAAFPGGPR